MKALLAATLRIIWWRYRGKPITVCDEDEDVFTGHLWSVTPQPVRGGYEIIMTIHGEATPEGFFEAERFDFRSVKWNKQKRRFEVPKSSVKVGTPSSSTRARMSGRESSSRLQMGQWRSKGR